ncbi:hypothetical protein [Pseudomonas viridiflava]|uniref:hypothetical protein n=1 Tax=Pseudomonas viridiflava TaxID=33069 RepID=UPI000EFAF677
MKINDLNGTEDLPIKRPKGGSRFWTRELNRLRLEEPGTRSWTSDQKTDILASKTRKFHGESIQGYHKYNALGHP